MTIVNKAKKLVSGEISVVREIPVEQLFVSPSEVRKTIDPKALAELANSIKQQGVIEALLVRPIDLDCMSGEPLPGAAKVGDAFEIVAGQRRLAASKLAGKTSCPCVVREMSDSEANFLRFISNAQREDLPPMEAAEAIGKLLDAPGATVESVAAALAMPVGYVSRRLKLLDAIEAVREALRYGAIEVGHALELARLSVHQQEELLEWLEVGYKTPEEGEDGEDANDAGDDDYDDEGICKYCEIEDDALKDAGRTWSNEKETVCDAPDCLAKAQAEAAMGGYRPTRETVAELRKRIASRELRVLGEAPFPLEDEIPPMACVECPKRSSNVQGLFDDILRDACTDPECYETKLKVWVKAELEKADRSGAELVMLYDGSAQDKAGVSKWNVVVGAECASAVPAIWVSGRLIGWRTQICRDKKCATCGEDAPAPARATGSKGGATPKLSAADKAKAEAQKAERQKLLKKVEAEKVYREKLWNEIVAVGILDSAEQHIVRKACAQMAAQGGGLVARALGMSDDAFDYDKRDNAVTCVAALPYKTVLRAAALAFAVADVGVSEYSVLHGRKPERMEEIAALLGIDVAAIRGDKPAKKATPKPPTKKATPKKDAVKPLKNKVAEKAMVEKIASVAPKLAKKAIVKSAAKKAIRKPAKKVAKKGGK